MDIFIPCCSQERKRQDYDAEEGGGGGGEQEKLRSRDRGREAEIQAKRQEKSAFLVHEDMKKRKNEVAREKTE